MKALLITIFIIACCQTVTGCSSMRNNSLIVKPIFSKDVKHSTGNFLLAESLEDVKPLVDLNMEE